jgi:two-component system, OmpR family, sensor histidine kinase KdpD
MPEQEKSAQHFLNLIRTARRGKLKIYIGMSAGVGKTFRMLQEAQALLRNGIDVKIGYVETHNRHETVAMLEGLPIVPRRTIFYKGKELEEMDVNAIISLRPEVVVVDELAHTNIGGSKNEKRWQDVLEILDAGINVISAVNIQHIESLNEEVKQITGIEVQERVPDKILGLADEVVNIDMTADELIARLKEGKIYAAEKIQAAMQNFFKAEHILQLRELALKEVASQVERKVETVVPSTTAMKHERFLACISSNEDAARAVIRKTARLANYYNSKWFALYVQRPTESSSRIPLHKQRHLINNFKLATELGAEVIKLKETNVAKAISQEALQRDITTICMGKPQSSVWRNLISGNLLYKIIKELKSTEIDIVILS